MAVLRSLVFLIVVFHAAATQLISLVQTISIFGDVHMVESTPTVPAIPTYIFPHKDFASPEVFTQVSDQPPTGRPRNLEQERTVITQVPDDAPTTRAITQVPNDAPTTHTTRVITQVPDDALTNMAAYYTTVFVFLSGHQHLI